MTRPTQAYANKVHEKAPTTPPRRPGTANKKSASAKSGTSRRPVSKTTSAATSAAASPETDRKPEPSAARKLAHVTERTPIAEEEITIAEKEEDATPRTPKTPERQPTIMEEKEENTDDVPMAYAAPEFTNEPEVEEADAPLADSRQENGSVAEPKGEVKVEKPDSQPVSSGAVDQVQAQVEEKEEL